MVARDCPKGDCTVAQTGRCLLNNDPATCPERNPTLRAIGVPSKPEDAAPLDPPQARPRFEPSLSLGLDDANCLMARHYVHLIGILGAPKAGKTGALVSLYLLLASGKLRGFRFADSLSLMAFDQLSRGVRRWNQGAMPDQMTERTELADDRKPGFLHLRVRREGSLSKHDLLLADLPGEWTTQLIDRNVSSRLSFLHRADAFWVVVDGRKLAEHSSRNYTIHRTNILLERLAQFAVPPMSPPVTLVVTHRDWLDSVLLDPIERIAATAQRLSLQFSAIEIASFSKNAAVTAGFGLPELLQCSLAGRALKESPIRPVLADARHVLRYRN